MTGGEGGLIERFRLWFDANRPRFEQCGVELEYNEVFDDGGGSTPTSATLWATGPARLGRVSVWDIGNPEVDACADVEVMGMESGRRIIDARFDFAPGEPKVLDLEQFIALITSREAG